MLEGEETQEVNTAESSEPQSSQPEANQASDSTNEKTTSQSVPYERFQEVIAAKNEIANQVKAYEQRMAEMERRFSEQQKTPQAPQKTVHPFVAKLREIDPGYAEYIESLESRVSKIDSLEQDSQASKLERLRSDYESTVERLHGANKVPEAVRPLIKEMLDGMALRGDLKDVKGVEAAYKKQAERFTSLLETTKRETTKSYVTDKSKDSSAPTSQPKGGRASPKEPAYKDKEEAFASIVKSALTKSKAERDI
jgi:hypothetical protein